MELLSWDSVVDAMTRSSDWDLPMGGTREVHFGHDGRGGYMFVRARAGSLVSSPPTRLSEIATQLVATSSGRWLEVSTRQASIFREFHRFAGLFTEDLEKGASPLAALESALNRWRLLASERRLLSQEQQLGLHGELLLLEALIARDGPTAVDAWTARDRAIPDRHDFRLPRCDVEVKTTRTQRRRHVIHGLRQLVPAPGRQLFVMSIMLRPAGLAQGSSLRLIVERLRGWLASDGSALSAFTARLDAAAYREEDAEHYAERLCLNEPPKLIEVDDSCPRITPDLFLVPKLEQTRDRIGDVSYTVDLTGLGHDRESPVWDAHLPNVEIEG